MSTSAKFEKLLSECTYSGPCSEMRIRDAEIELGVTFPKQYRDFLTNYGSAVFKGGEFYGLPDATQNNPPLWQDVVVVTKRLRGWGQAGTENKSYIPISDDGMSTYFFLDTIDTHTSKIIAVGPGVEKQVSETLQDFMVNLSEGNLQY